MDDKTRREIAELRGQVAALTRAVAAMAQGMPEVVLREVRHAASAPPRALDLGQELAELARVRGVKTPPPGTAP